MFHNQELFLLNCKTCFQGVEKGYIGNEWVKLQIEIIQYSRPVKFLYLSSTNFTLFALEYFVSFIHYTYSFILGHGLREKYYIFYYGSLDFMKNKRE